MDLVLYMVIAGSAICAAAYVSVGLDAIERQLYEIEQLIGQGGGSDD